MRPITATLAVLACVVLCSCNENQPPTTDARHSPSSMQESAAPGPATGTRSAVAAQPFAPRASAAERSGPVPPADAQWTLYCGTVRGPAHVEESARMKAGLSRNPRLPDWYLVHHAEESTLYYGYYANVEDRKARSDKSEVASLTGIDGERRFGSAQFVPLSSPDPDSPPEWSLENTKPTMFWSLQVAAFRGVANRKQLAVEAVRQAREEGIEAYYFHGESISSVCIGAWPIKAVRRQGEKNVARTIDADTPLVVSTETLPPNATLKVRDSGARNALVMAPKLEVDDASLAAMIRRFPTHAVNGYEYMQQARNGTKVPSPSFLVQIPNRETLIDKFDDDDTRAAWFDGKRDRPDRSDRSDRTDRTDRGDRPERTTGSEGQPAYVNPTGPAAPPPRGSDLDDPTLGKLRTLGEH